MRRFPVAELPDAPGSRLTLDGPTSHHLLRVCRHPRGNELWVFDGHGRQARARLAEVTERDEAVLEMLDAPVRAAPERPLWVVLAVLKGPAMERALRMGTEAGATTFAPVLTARTVARGDRHERWARVVTSAAQQCGRADVPTVRPVQRLTAACDGLPDGLARYVAAPGAARSDHDAPRGSVVAIGPEGGWRPSELRELVEAGFHPLGLGSWVLRADTAVAVAVATLAT